MRHTDEYRNPTIARRLIDSIRQRAQDEPLRIMEFCGGHTHAIMRYGLRQALAPHVRMLSGPGCPVCVTADQDIDYAIALAHLPGVTVATFGDMIRVPGTRASLQEARAADASIHVVYSALDAVEYAQKHPDRKIVMLGIGFETTAPTVAGSILQAHQEGLKNYYVYSMHKLTPPAMRGILDAGEVRVDAILGPGHVTAITGWEAWRFLPDEYGVPCAVSGFEPLDILQAVDQILQARLDGNPQVVNSYSRGVTAEGNRVAQQMMNQVFEPSDAAWRGLGEIPQSGLAIRETFAAYDARRAFDLAVESEPSPRQQACRCGDVLRGLIEPPECPLFGSACTPARPVGPCMVSAEGSCAAHYRYGGSIE
jgi:hydrogenase expression/formation protein HypD